VSSTCSHMIIAQSSYVAYQVRKYSDTNNAWNYDAKSPIKTSCFDASIAKLLGLIYGHIVRGW
jgi:hypothetical protein